MNDNKLSGNSVSNRSTLWRRRSIYALAVAAILYLAPTDLSLAQGDSARSLAERSAIVLRGTVLKVNASDEPLQPPANNTVVIKVSRMYAGSEVTGDQTGRRVTVVLSRPLRLKVGSEGVFFGNPRFVGKSLTIVDVGETSSPKAMVAADLEAGLQARRDLPLRERLSTASMVFRGKVESERPLPVSGQKRELRVPPSEHDPEWHVASVRVVEPISGVAKDALVTIIFPASRDIMWFNTPKLSPGMDAIFITHKPEREQELLLRTTGVTDFMKKQPAELVTQPFDVRPVSDLQRVQRLTKEIK